MQLCMQRWWWRQLGQNRSVRADCGGGGFGGSRSGNGDGSDGGGGGALLRGRQAERELSTGQSAAPPKL